jgi:hypothetical protein
MDLHPANSSIRGAEEVGHEHSWPTPTRVWAYLCTRNQRHLELYGAVAAGRSAIFGPRKWVTVWGSYSAFEACSSLALPSYIPDVVLEFTLPPGVFVRGPAWVEPFPTDYVLADNYVPRSGNGIELLILDPVDLSTLDPVAASITSPAAPWNPT